MTAYMSRSQHLQLVDQAAEHTYTYRLTTVAADSPTGRWIAAATCGAHTGCDAQGRIEYILTDRLGPVDVDHPGEFTGCARALEDTLATFDHDTAEITAVYLVTE